MVARCAGAAGCALGQGWPSPAAAAAGAGRSERTALAASDGFWEPPSQVYSELIRSLPGNSMADRKILSLGKAVLRRKAKLVKTETVSGDDAQNVAGELVRVMRGPRLPGREKGGALTAPQVGTPSRVIVVEDPPGEISDLSAEERTLQGREKPFGPKLIFNPRLKPVGEETSFLWEKSPSMPGYRALVERHVAVQVKGLDPKGQEVEYVARDWEARLIQQSVDMLDGVMFTDRCVIRSLRHLDARKDPLPMDCPAVGAAGQPREPLSEAQLAAAAEQGGSRGFLGGLPGIGRPNALLAGSLLLRLKAEEVADVSSSQVQSVARELRDALASGKHPLGIAAPVLGHRLRMVAVGETEEQVSDLPARTKIQEEHRIFGPQVLINPVVTRAEKSPDTFFWERSTCIPGYAGVVGRALEIDVEALNEEGSAISFTARGWQARMIQQQVDHLDGVLYVDQMERRSFKRDNVEDELPDDVPFGVRPVMSSKALKRSGTSGRSKAASKSGSKSGSKAKRPQSGGARKTGYR